MTNDYKVTETAAPPRRTMHQGLTGQAAYQYGLVWGRKAKTQYSGEDRAKLLCKLGPSDYERGVRDGLTGEA